MRKDRVEVPHSVRVGIRHDPFLFQDCVRNVEVLVGVFEVFRSVDY